MKTVSLTLWWASVASFILSSPALAAKPAKPEATINDPIFLQDIADGISLEENWSLQVDVSTDPSAVPPQVGEYRYKFGIVPQACREEADYSEWRAPNIAMDLVVPMPAEGERKAVKICLQARDANDPDRRKKTTVYRWRVEGRAKTIIVAPTSPSETPTPIVQWRETRDALSYTLDVSTNVDCSNPVQSFSGLTANQQALAPLVDGTYYACVHVVKANKTQPAINNPYEWVQAAGDLPGGFAITAPLSPVTDTNAPLATWDASLDADSYDVIVSTLADCSSSVQSFSGLTETAQQLGPLVDGNYFLCVSAVNNVGMTPAANSGLSWQQQTTAPGSFAIIAPSTLSTNATPTVAWEIASAADTYDLIVASDAACNNVVQSFAALSGTSQILATLDDGDYFACVSATNLAGSTVASNNGYGWTQLTVAPGAFTIISPVSPSTTSTPTVSWSAAMAASSYDLVVSESADCLTPVQQFSGLVTTSQLLGALEDKTYFACVTAHNVNGSTLASNNGYAWDQITMSPKTFDLLGPSGLISTATPTITWEASPGADSYDVVLSSDSACSVVLQSATGVLGTSFDVAALAEDVYFSCVTARNAAGSTPASNNGLMFTYDVTGPGAFSIIAPEAVVDTVDVVVSWEQAADAVSYTLTVGTNPDCSGVLTTVSDLTVTSRELLNLAEGVYHVCVSAFDENSIETTASNDGYSFEVALAPAEPQYIFVSSLEFGIDPAGTFPPFGQFFGYAMGADHYCTQLADAAGLIDGWDGQELIYTALVSDSTRDIRNTIAVRRPVENMNGDIVARSIDDFFDGGLENAIRYDENGNTVAGDTRVWTGTASDGFHSGSSCGDWIDFLGTATYGLSNSVDNSWIEAGTLSCTTNQAGFERLYCLSP